MEKQKPKETDTTTMTSQNLAISQLMVQVLQIKIENKQLLDQFD